MQIPPNILASIQAATAHDVYPVTGAETYAEQILKTEALQFDSGAVLRLTRTDLPYVALCARKILLRAPEIRSEIRLGGESSAVGGMPGAAGSVGRSGVTGRGGPGASGLGGTAGANGTAGASAQLPLLYIFTEEVQIHPGSPVSWFDLTLNVPGAAGGGGGLGGPGGSGGDGGDGSRGVDGNLICKQQPGDGGAGGPGAPGGAGGQGGNGSAGGSLVFVGPAKALVQLAWTRIVNVGGGAGAGGKGGLGGDGGRGGQAGASTMFCHGARPGYAGLRGPTGPDGVDGHPGAKGTVICILEETLDGLF